MKIILLLLSFVIAGSSNGQPQPLPSQLTIIGTIHTGNKYFNHKKLLAVLKEIKPDIILWEQSFEFKKVFGLLTANALNIWKPGIEQLSLQKYSRLNKKCKILPYDTAFFNKREYVSTITKNEIKLFEALNKKLYNNTMKADDSLAYIKFMTLRNNYYLKMIDTTLERINKKDMMAVTREIYDLDKKLIKNLVQKYVTDSSLINWYASERAFWTHRNNYMVKQIINYTTLYQSKKIVVLTGLDHKYYLLDKILESQNGKIDITEFYKDNNSAN